MKEDHNPSDFQGRSKKQYESYGKMAYSSIIILLGVLTIYGLLTIASRVFE